jgi:periplasmic glucans biosynthesis protein
VQRRTLLLAGTSLALFASAPVSAFAGADAKNPKQPVTFDAGVLRRMAQELAQKSFQAPDSKLPEPLAHLTYDQYRDFRFDPQRALWRDQGLLFTLQLFHRGFLYTNRVDLYEVVDGVAQPIHYSPDLFTFGANPRPPDGDLGFAGFRIHTPLNRPDYFDEVAAFLGASYFRAVGKGQGYGLSARGLAIGTAQPSGEEFPIFKTFWIERPHPGVDSIVVNALLDSQSAAGAFRFSIRPGETTIFDVEATLYPRTDIAEAGIAPLTSMFYFDGNNRFEIDDYRPAVHDSDGLLIWTGHGEQFWRPLNDPHDLQLSTFSDVNPRGFGLMQRKRSFAAYDDLEAHYELRPSLWIEPIGVLTDCFAPYLHEMTVFPNGPMASTTTGRFHRPVPRLVQEAVPRPERLRALPPPCRSGCAAPRQVPSRDRPRVGADGMHGVAHHLETDHRNVGK